MCRDAGVLPDHPHRFLHSLAADLLTKGASEEDVVAILANSPAIVIKHYSQFIKSRQDRLDETVAKTREKPNSRGSNSLTNKPAAAPPALAMARAKLDGPQSKYRQ